MIVSKKERINALKRQMMIHCYLYYVHDQPIISDDEWQERANKLEQLIKIYSNKTGLWDEQFEGWTGATGFNLKYDDWVINKALYLKRLHEGGIYE